MRFKLWRGEDTHGLLVNDTHMIFKWDDADIFFSAARRGNALSCHFSATKGALRHIKQAINEFCEFAFFLFDWCTMILAVIVKPSVERLVMKCGFSEVCEAEGKHIYMRAK